MILIISDNFDLHADVVTEKLKKPYFRLNIDVDSLKNTYITYQDNDWLITQKGLTCKASEISCVWPRRSNVQITLEQQMEMSNGFRLWRSEWNRTLFGLYNYLNNAKWLNHIRDSTLADNKYHQEKTANQVGLRIPPFISSNEREKLLSFLRNNTPSVIKFMSQDMYTSDQGELLGLYVNKISEQDLYGFSPSSENPITIQKYIEKQYEVRYTVIGDKHLACAIESQKSQKSNIDWRRYDIPNTPHRKICPPNEVTIKVNDLMRALNLNFGALDFIVDENHDWWFLEINSAGQWLWIEDLSGLDISGSISQWLNNNCR